MRRIILFPIIVLFCGSCNEKIDNNLSRINTTTTQSEKLQTEMNSMIKIESISRDSLRDCWTISLILNNDSSHTLSIATDGDLSQLPMIKPINSQIKVFRKNESQWDKLSLPSDGAGIEYQVSPGEQIKAVITIFQHSLSDSIASGDELRLTYSGIPSETFNIP